DQAAALLEIVDTERRREARRPRRRQYVVRAGAVVAEAFARERPEKDRARMAKQRLPAVRVAGADLEVLWRDPVADLAGLLHRTRQHERAAAFERRTDHVAPRHCRQEPLDLREDATPV